MIYLAAACIGLVFGLLGGMGGAWLLRTGILLRLSQVDRLSGELYEDVRSMETRIKRREGQDAREKRGPTTPKLAPSDAPDPEAAAELAQILDVRKKGGGGNRAPRTEQPRDEFPTMAEGQAALSAVLPE